jgi:hypothetical protein
VTIPVTVYSETCFSEQTIRAPNALLAAAVAYVATKFNERATGKRFSPNHEFDSVLPRGVYTVESVTSEANADLIFLGEWYLTPSVRNMLGPWQARCHWLESSQSIKLYLFHQTFGEFKP